MVCTPPSVEGGLEKCEKCQWGLPWRGQDVFGGGGLRKKGKEKEKGKGKKKGKRKEKGKEKRKKGRKKKKGKGKGKKKKEIKDKWVKKLCAYIIVQRQLGE